MCDQMVRTLSQTNFKGREIPDSVRCICLANNDNCIRFNISIVLVLANYPDRMVEIDSKNLQKKNTKMNLQCVEYFYWGIRSGDA